MNGIYCEDPDVELRQSRDEGKNTAVAEKVLEAIKLSDCDETKKELSNVLSDILEKTPVSPDYPYFEPSDLEKIRASRPADRPRFSPVKASPDKIKGAWFGRTAGCIFGKPVEGWKRESIIKFASEKSNYPIRKYLTDVDCMPNDDDTNYTMLGLWLLEKFGFDFTTRNVADAWLILLPAYSVFTAERVAYRNILCGVPIEKVATTYNPYREWIGAQIRGDMFGYVYPGEPEKAAAMAFRDASLSHIKNGIYGEMFVAAALAAAAVSDSLDEIISAGLGEIPEKCRLRHEIDYITDFCRREKDYNKAIEEVLRIYPHNTGHNSVHTIANAMFVIIALYYGNWDLTETLGIAAECGMDTDCNCATAGSIVGMRVGFGNLPKTLTEPLNDTMRSDLKGFDFSKISELAERTVKVMDKK